MIRAVLKQAHHEGILLKECIIVPWALVVMGFALGFAGVFE